jgi:hypothetical protein
MFTLFEDYTEINIADEQRIAIIQEYLDHLKTDPDHNDWRPEPYEILDNTGDGYEWQTFVQNIGNNHLIYWEGWVKECWQAIYHQRQYKGRSKEKVLQMFLSERMTQIAKELNLTIINSDYEWYELWNDYIADGYIIKVKMRINTPIVIT